MSETLHSLLVALHNLGLPCKDRKRSALLFVAWKYYITGEQIHTIQMFVVGATGSGYTGLKQYFTKSHRCESLR